MQHTIRGEGVVFSSGLAAGSRPVFWKIISHLLIQETLIKLSETHTYSHTCAVTPHMLAHISTTHIYTYLTHSIHICKCAHTHTHTRKQEENSLGRSPAGAREDK